MHHAVATNLALISFVVADERKVLDALVISSLLHIKNKTETIKV